MARHFLSKANKLIRLTSRPSYRRGLRYRVAAAIEHEDTIRSLKLGTLIDVGANIGQFSLLARAIHPQILIHAFEPLPSAAAHYERLFMHHSGVNLHRVAAGEMAGMSEIHISGRPDSSSMLPITELQNEIFPGTAQASVATIQVERVDDVLKASVLVDPVLIKLDVQGFELSALKGMPKLLQRAYYVYAEVSFKELYKGQPLAHEIVAWLSSVGFRFSGVYNPTAAGDGSAVQADFLFTKVSP